jgi:hypothetical protein
MEANMKPIASRATLAIGLVVLTWQSPALAQSPAAALFDKHVAAGLPQTFSLAHTSDDERGVGVDRVVVEEKLDTDVVYPDGSHATTYIGTANGREATFTRIGDELNVSAPDESTHAPPLGGHVQRLLPQADDTITAPATLASSESPRTSEGRRPKELQFWIFLHDESGETNYAKFQSWYLSWWLRDMERTVKPGAPLKVFIREHIPGVTDFDYAPGTLVDKLVAFTQVADEYIKTENYQPSRLTKTMLFIGKRPENWPSDIYGISLQGNTVAMASSSGPRHIIAHEFGHSLDAVHDHAEDRPFCVTNMYGYGFGKVSCQVYTKGNDQKIRAHVADALKQGWNE